MNSLPPNLKFAEPLRFQFHEDEDRHPSGVVKRIQGWSGTSNLAGSMKGVIAENAEEQLLCDARKGLEDYSFHMSVLASDFSLVYSVSDVEDGRVWTGASCSRTHRFQLEVAK